MSTYGPDPGGPYGPPSPYGGPGGGAPYGAPGYVAYGQVQLPKTVGIVALVVGLVATLGAVVVGVVMGTSITLEQLEHLENDTTPDLTGPFVLAASFLLWFTLGVWAIVQGIIAIATKRGVGAGIAALILGLVGPWAGLFTFGIVAGLTAARY